MTTADRVVRARQLLRETAYDLGHCVTFMAKPTDQYGNGLHVHHSLHDTNGPVFCERDRPGATTALFGAWLGGLMATLPAATSMLVPTVNAYRRMVGWAAAPTTPSWAEDDKSTALRLLRATPASTRVEHRLAAADANPYLVLAAVLAGGLAGLDHCLEPPPPLGHAGWGLPPQHEHLPNTITKAADVLARDPLLREQLGDALVDYWVNTRRWEWLMYHTTGGDPVATTTTDWELDRYFETVG